MDDDDIERLEIQRREMDERIGAARRLQEKIKKAKIALDFIKRSGAKFGEIEIRVECDGKNDERMTLNSMISTEEINEILSPPLEALELGIVEIVNRLREKLNEL